MVSKVQGHLSLFSSLQSVESFPADLRLQPLFRDACNDGKNLPVLRTQFRRLERISPVLSAEEVNLIHRGIKIYGEFDSRINLVISPCIKILEKTRNPAILKAFINALDDSIINVFDIVSGVDVLLSTLPGDNLSGLLLNLTNSESLENIVSQLLEKQSVEHRIATDDNDLSSLQILDNVPIDTRILFVPLEDEISFNVNTLTEQLKIVSELNELNLSLGMINLLDEALIHQAQSGFSKKELLQKILPFLKTKPSNEVLFLISECMKYYRLRKWDMSPLVDKFQVVSMNYSSGDRREFCKYALDLLNRTGLAPKTGSAFKDQITQDDYEYIILYSARAGLPTPIDMDKEVLRLQRVFSQETIEKTRISEILKNASRKLSNVELGYMQSRDSGFGQMVRRTPIFSHQNRLRALYEKHPVVLPLLETIAKSSCIQAHHNGTTENNHIIETYNFLLFTIDQGEMLFSLQPFNNFNHSLNGNIMTIHEERAILEKKILAHSLISILQMTQNPTSIARANEFLSYLIVADDLPLETNTYSRQQMQNETFEVMRRAFNMMHGAFDINALECRRSPDRELPLLVRMAMNISPEGTDSIHVIDAKDKDEFPGRGYIIKGIDPKKVFLADRKLYKDAWGKIADQIDSLPKTNFIFTRGLIAIIGPRSKEFFLPSGKGNLIHYSLVAYNDHFHNSGCNGVVLVPTSILLEELKEKHIPLDDFRGFGYIQDDINSSNLSMEQLELVCQQKGLNLINLTSPSNCSGSLSNAFPPYSSPYFSWERTSKGTHDLTGHTHKYYAPKYTGSPDFLRAHTEVHTVSSSYLNLFDLLNFSFAAAHKGQTSGEIVNITDSEQFDVQTEPIQSEAMGENSTIMLKEYQRWKSSDNPPVLQTIDLVNLRAKGMVLVDAKGSTTSGYVFGQDMDRDVFVWDKDIMSNVWDKNHFDIRLMQSE